MSDNNELKIFKLNRIKFKELYNDALAYIKATYKAADQEFNTASPFGQLLQVIIHLGRMILYYIEDSISGLNIKTAYRPDQIKGLAMLAGHDSSRPISSRGAIQISFSDKGDTALNGQVCYIPNKTKIIYKPSGYSYVLLFGADFGKITMNAGNYIEANIIQGIIKLQSATGTGEVLQSYNFSERNYTEVDQYYVHVTVNGEQWDIVKSLNDLGYNQKGCIIRTGINSGIDLFFGNGLMGAIPEKGATIVIEYILSDGQGTNIFKDFANSGDNWQFDGDGLLQDGTTVKLDKNFKIKCITDVIFGTSSEDVALTQLIAPHVSRSFVLANEANYVYFFKRMNMFSDIQIIRGSYNVNGTSMMQLAYDEAMDNYAGAKQNYTDAIAQYGENSNIAKEALNDMKKAQNLINYAKTKLSDNTSQDNTLYLLLVPDINKRISKTENYFTCDESLFYLTKDEQENILNLINASGQRIITVENRIIQPKVARFSVNVEAKIWDNYSEEDVYSAGLDALSKYFLSYTRKDMIPVSDIISIFETSVPGIDSVKVWFDADVENQQYYGNGKYGLDDYGDIILTRTIVNANGQYQEVHDIMPLIRGGFISANGIEYSAVQTQSGYSAFNLYINDVKSNSKAINLSKYTALT